MASPIIKEEKIEVKQGMLKIASDDRSIFKLKKWKERYFVFCQIRKGDNYWLKLFYFKSHSSYKEGNIPKGSIDITTAKVIGMMDQDLHGLGHIIYIETPDKTHWLSASLCDDRSQWLLALRAYKYNDESKLPCEVKRAFSWHGTVSSRNQTEKRKSSHPSTDPYSDQNASSQKLRQNYPVCLKCRGIDVPREVYEWIRPEHSDIYVTVHGPSNKSYSVRESIYDIPSLREEPIEDDGGILMRGPVALPPVENSREDPLSDSYVNLTRSIGEVAKPIIRIGLPETASSSEEINDEWTNSTVTLPRYPSMGDYVSMTGKKDGNESEVSCSDSSNSGPRSVTDTSSVPSGLDVSHRSNSPYFKGSLEGILPENRHLSSYTTTVRNRYTPEPVLGGSIKLQQGGNEKKDERRDSAVMRKNDSCPEKISDNRDVHSSEKRKSGVNQMLQRKFNGQELVFLGEV